MTASWDLTVEFITLLGYSITSYPKIFCNAYASRTEERWETCAAILKKITDHVNHPEKSPNSITGTFPKTVQITARPPHADMHALSLVFISKGNLREAWHYEQCAVSTCSTARMINTSETAPGSRVPILFSA